jgi:hypothetical protein
MADNIKIVGEIIDTQQVSRYSEEDLNLLQPQTLKEDFGQINDYIEYFVYDAGGNLLNTDYNYLDFKLPSTSYIDPTNGALPIIEIDPVIDLQNLGYSSGEFSVQYSFFNNQISDSTDTGLFIKEISSDRTELRIGSTTLTNEQIESGSLDIINSYSGSLYFVDYLLNFGNNEQVIVVNTALNKIDSGYEILFKLYQPLPDTIDAKATLWVVKEKVNPYVFSINLDKLIIPALGPQLRGPNFDIDIPNKNNIGTSYQTFDNLLINLQGVSSSYQQLLSIITSQSIDINTDYSNFNNFVFFSSAEQRVINFYNKVKQIEGYNNDIVTYTPLTSSYPNLINDYNIATASINNTIANFDGFEYYMYFESGSTLTSSLEFGITPYPKSGSLKPFTLFPSNSTSASLWFNHLTSSADYYDDENQNNLTFTVPSFIKDDGNNEQYLTFLNMVGHYFDNIWIYLQAITEINLANNNLEQGVSKDLVYTVLQSLGTKLYNKYGDTESDLYLVGQDSGSANFDNNFTPTGSYLNNIPRKDLLAETYKRIYHNLPLLLKTKGTTYGLQTLISTFGITSSILNVKEYGGNLKKDSLNEYSIDKIRIIPNNIVTGSVLSPLINLQTYQTSSESFRTNDLQYVDISFSPETQIDTYASASIAVANPSWSLDDYIGDPRNLYDDSYPALVQQQDTYYNFTPEYMDYAGFIRLIQFFDNSLFKMIKDFVPARTSLSTGITISSPVLERNKWSYANPSSTSKINEYIGSIEGPTIGTEYTDIYQGLTGSRAAYYTGEFEGDMINYEDDWNERNFNPYLFPTASIITGSALNIFNHSEFNILLNNISSSLLSTNRRILEPIYVTNSSLRLAGYSSSYFAELQDSYESLDSYNKSRHEGIKISSLDYNTYTSASLTYAGDKSYGKTATIDKTVRQIGLFTEIVPSPFLPGRNKVSLKYLIDEFGGLTELNQRNKHWEDIQRTFILADNLDISLFDNQKFSNQKTTDGDKLIFDSGYSYYPIIYFTGSCSTPKQIYFESEGGANAYLLKANNNLLPRTITGSVTENYPLVGGSYPKAVYNIFNNPTETVPYYTPGTSTLFPTYSVQESGDYKASANLDVYVTMSQGGNVTWSFGLWKDDTLISSQSIASNLTIAFVATSSGGFAYISSCIWGAVDTITLAGSGPFIAPIDIPISGGGIISKGTTLYRHSILTTATYSGIPYGCTVSNPKIVYSIGNPSLNYFPDDGAGMAGCRCAGDPAKPVTSIFKAAVAPAFYEIPNFTTDASGTRLISFNLNLNPITNLALGTKLIPKLQLTGLSTGVGFTASLSEGSLNISSLATSTGYASTICPYFSSSSIAADVNNGIFHTLTLNTGVSNFYDKGYQFVPNPVSGALLPSSLYSTYGDVDYPFIIEPYDKVITYLSDSTYVESTILDVSSTPSSSLTSSLIQITLDSDLSSTYRSDVVNGSYLSFLILKKVKDETNTHLTFKKRDGKTSYGFIIPQNLSPDVLANIDTITKEVKLKVLSDQSIINNINGGSF